MALMITKRVLNVDLQQPFLTLQFFSKSKITVQKLRESVEWHKYGEVWRFIEVS